MSGAGPNVVDDEIYGSRMCCSYSHRPTSPFLEMSSVHFFFSDIVVSSSAPASCSLPAAAPSDCTRPVPDIPEWPLSQPSAAAFKAGAIRDAEVSRRLDFPSAEGDPGLLHVTPAS